MPDNFSLFTFLPDPRPDERLWRGGDIEFEPEDTYTGPTPAQIEAQRQSEIMQARIFRFPGLEQAAHQKAAAAYAAKEGHKEKDRQAFENKRMQSLAEAKTAAMGAKKSSGSLVQFLSAITGVGEKELAWLDKFTGETVSNISRGQRAESIQHKAAARKSGHQSTRSLASDITGLTEWWEEYSATNPV